MKGILKKSCSHTVACFGAEENDGEGFDPGDVGTRDYDDATDQSGKRHAPRAGNWDGRQHIGEGPWDGGSGGTGTATWHIFFKAGAIENRNC